MRNAVCVYIAILLTACSSSPVPKNILPPDKLQQVVYDLVQVDEYINNYLQADSLIKKKRSVYYEQVFNLHHTNRKEFYTSLHYYEQHPDLQKALFDSVYEQANTRAVKKVNPAVLRNQK